MSEFLERMSNSSQSTRPTGRSALGRITCPFTLKSEGETRFSEYLNLFVSNMGCSYEFDWVNIILTVI